MSDSTGCHGSGMSGQQMLKSQRGGPTWADKVKGVTKQSLHNARPHPLVSKPCSPPSCSLGSDMSHTERQPEMKREDTEEEVEDGWKRVTRGRLKTCSVKKQRSEGSSGGRSDACVLRVEGGGDVPGAGQGGNMSRSEMNRGNTAVDGEQGRVEEGGESGDRVCEGEEDGEVGGSGSSRDVAEDLVEGEIVQGEAELTGRCKGGECVEDSEGGKEESGAGGGEVEGCEDGEVDGEVVLVEERVSVGEAGLSSGEERSVSIPELDMTELQTKERAHIFVKPENVST